MHSGGDLSVKTREGQILFFYYYYYFFSYFETSSFEQFVAVIYNLVHLCLVLVCFVLCFV